MGVHCVVLGCQNNSCKKVEGIRFHRFPMSKPELCHKWTVAVHRESWQPTKYSVICNTHFLEDDYKPFYQDGRHELKDYAVPSVFSNYPPHLLKTSKKSNAIVKSENPPKKKAQKRKVATPDPVEPHILDVPETNNFISAPSTEIKPDMERMCATQIKVEPCILDVPETNDLISAPGTEIKSDMETMCATQIKVELHILDVPETNDLISAPSTDITPDMETMCATQNEVATQTVPTTSPTEKNLRGKIRTLQQKVRRKSKRIKTMKELIKNLQKRTDEVYEILTANFSGSPLEYVLNDFKNNNAEKTIRHTLPK